MATMEEGKIDGPWLNSNMNSEKKMKHENCVLICQHKTLSVFQINITIFLSCVIAFFIAFFFESVKIWVGRMTLNREKRDGLTE